MWSQYICIYNKYICIYNQSPNTQSPNTQICMLYTIFNLDISLLETFTILSGD